jgi:hypothetical protein
MAPPTWARSHCANVIVEYWPTEHEQRNFGLARLYLSDWVLIVDADELYAPEDIARLIGMCEASTDIVIRTARMKEYWKTTDYAFGMSDSYSPVIAVNPKKAQFELHRQIRRFERRERESTTEGIDLTVHHMSWVKSDEKVSEKIRSFSHADVMHAGWYENVWLKWTPAMKIIQPPVRLRAIPDPAQSLPPACLAELPGGIRGRKCFL